MDTYWAVMADTIFMILAYVYFFALYRERYMGLWLISWLVFFGRIVLFDYGPFPWRDSVLGFTVYQVMVTTNGLLFVWGTHIFINKPMKMYWPYSALAVCTVSELLTVLQYPLMYKLLLPTLFGGLILLDIGRIFVLHVQTRGIGNHITGYAFISWGILTLAMPFTINIAWLSPWCYLAAGVARLVIALGMLMVYYEKTRSDLAEKERQYRLLAENAVDVIFRLRLRPEVRVEYMSPAVTVVTGYSPEEYYSDPGLLKRVVHPEDLPAFTGFVQNPSQDGDLPLSFRLIRRNREIVWLEQRGLLIFDKDGNVSALEGILRDVTTRKNMEQIVFQAEKMNMVGQMAVSVAHEIRNPLTSVRGYLQLIRMKEESKNKERYDLMIDELDRTNTIISEYLLLAKDKIPDRKECSLNDIIIAIFPLLQANAAAAKAEINLSLGVIPALHLDENEIRQLLFNIVNNGLEAMPAGGELVIRTFSVNDKVVLAISDQGSGIPSHILANLGTPFLTTKTSGTGLGLPVCYRIACRHDATINVETSGHGTTILVEFNLLRAVV
jgi:two-component system sporulation sensor kinase C